MNYTEREYRDALRLYPTGVSVVTATTEDGMDIGITVGSFMSVSLDPPLISYSIGKDRYTARHFAAVPFFAVNVLREDQADISTRFARPLTDKWSNVAHRRGVTRSPIIDPVLAVFECENYAQYECGDHLIVVGRVVHFEGSKEVGPLVFCGGGYCGARDLNGPDCRD